jgi:phospholipid/cholesterol/gamma-HCH transport system substrate-binding protein
MAAVKRRSYDLILGAFVALGLFVLVVIVFLIGKERRLFDSTVAVEAHFPNVAGLALGADVMLAGVVVGRVSDIKFPRLRPDMPGLLRDVTIVMEISRSSIKWIREDSIARIDSKGLLGDKIINISIGAPELPEVQSGAMIKSTPPIDFNKALQQAQEILQNVTETVSDAKDIFKGFVSEGGDQALAKSAKSVQRILKEVETGGGVLHELIFAKKAGKDAVSIIARSDNLLKEAEGIAKDLKKISQEVKEGHGLVHSLIFDPEGKKTIDHLNDSLKSVAQILNEVREGSGIAHDLIYANNQGQFLQSLNKAGKDLEAITKDLREGRGSLGLLLKDPSLYNEIYGLVGNLRRNRLLKAIIRYGISQQAPPEGNEKLEEK